MRTPLLTAAVLAASVVLTACGGTATDDTAAPATPTPSLTTSDAPTGDGFPLTVTSGDGAEVTFEASPQRIVSISPTATETLFAIGAGEQVVAVDSFSTYPDEAPVTDIVAFEPNVEAIAAYEPDLVIVGYDTNDVVAGLRSLDIPTIVHPAATTLDDAWAQMIETGRITGHPAEAESLVTDLQGQVEDLVASVPPTETALTYYHELDDQYYSATSTTFIGQIYALFGLQNVADPHDPDGEAFGYPQLSAEVIIDADPDLIFLASGACCQQDADTVAARPGWEQITAVRNGAITLLEDDIVSRWGPRIVEFVRTVADAVTAAGAAQDEAA